MPGQTGGVQGAARSLTVLTGVLGNRLVVERLFAVAQDVHDGDVERGEVRA
jgi:hypothetical protein